MRVIDQISKEASEASEFFLTTSEAEELIKESHQLTDDTDLHQVWHQKRSKFRVSCVEKVNVR
eukprot:764679-Hanusia_phi.AAC.1